MNLLRKPGVSQTESPEAVEHRRGSLLAVGLIFSFIDYSEHKVSLNELLSKLVLMNGL